MSFVSEFDALPVDALVQRALSATPAAVRESMGRAALSLADFAQLISPAAGEQLETMGRLSHTMTRRRFGKVMRLFAPLYVSNECVNKCKYCGFARDNSILRVTLSPDEVLQEARAILAEGFRNILLVAGEHPKWVPVSYLAETIQRLHAEVPSISLEIGPLDTDSYRTLVEACADGLVIYQETYDRELYKELHPSGPKRDFNWRLETPERACDAGFRRIGLGPLFGLGDWRREAICVAAHAQYLLRHCWKALVTISMPRIRPCAGEFQALTHMTDRDLVQLVCAFRIMFPDVGLVLSTRETPALRDGLIPLGITMISAGSHTEPGGYTGAGRENLHSVSGTLASGHTSAATGQFAIADERSAAEVAQLVRRLGYEPVWKDWDSALIA